MARYNRYYYNTRYILPLMIGIIVGFAFSLFCTPFYDCDNRLRRMHIRATQEEQQQLDILEQEHQKQIDEFEPRINLQGKPKKPQKPVQKLVRPRYATTELNIRYKLFVAIISSSRTLTNLATFFNQTVGPFAKKLTFFVNNAEMNEKLLLESTPPGISVVNFNDDRDHLLPFHTLKYVVDNYIQQYDWFFFISDNSYIRAPRLLDFLNHISITQDLYMGFSLNDQHSVYCSLSAGIILSNTLIHKLHSKMEWCTKNSYSEDPTDNLGRCVLHSTNIPCTNMTNGRTAHFHLDNNFNFDNEIDQLMYSPYFNQSLTVGRVKDVETMKKLHLYFNQVEMDEINAEIDSLEKNILDTVCDTPEGCDSLTWPLGVPAPYKPTSRHDVIRYDYFNQTHVFLGGDFDVVNEFTEYYKKDIDEVVSFAMENLNKNNNNRFLLHSILNGYKQFDPTRGSSYILDLLVFDSFQSIELHKRVNIMRPLGLVQLIPMPYVTENTRINLIVSFSVEYDIEEINGFFNNYERFILEVKEVAEKINLFVIYLTIDNDVDYELNSKQKKNYGFIKEIINELTKKYSSLLHSSSRILEDEVKIKNVSMYFSDNYRRLAVAEHITKNISDSGLILMASPCVEMQSEFLNRVRLNTIRGLQIFFPIPFYEFMPNIVYPFRPFPPQVEINKNVGYFNMDSYDFVSFYNSDYTTTRNKFITTNKLIKSSQNYTSINIANHVNDLYDLFSRNTDIHIIRATDQALKCRWHLKDNCDRIKHSVEERQTCNRQRESSLGTKAQLAMHLMKNYDIISRT